MHVKFLRPFLVALAVSMPALSFPAGAEDAPRFVSVIDDLPLMSGLVEAGEGVEFATPQGRIAETTAQATMEGAMSKKAVLDFYAQTLPQLGWTRAGEARFVREGETLDLVFGVAGGGQGGVLSVRFSLAPTDK